MTFLKLRRKLFSLKMATSTILSKINVILLVAQHVTTVIFFSAWEKSRVKLDNSLNSTQKMRTMAWSLDFRTKCLLHAFMQWHLNFNSGMLKVYMILLLWACLSFWPWVWIYGQSDTFYNIYRFKSSLVLIYYSYSVKCPLYSRK